MTTQLAVRLPTGMVQQIDALVASGDYATRADLVRAALDRLIAEAQRREVDAAIVAGYEARPDEAPDAWLQAAARAMVAEEPW